MVYTILLSQEFLNAFSIISIIILVLLSITLILSIFNASTTLKIKKKVVDTESETVSNIKAQSGIPASAANENISDLELVAVITASIAASLNTSADKLVVRSIRKVDTWKEKTISENNTL